MGHEVEIKTIFYQSLGVYSQIYVSDSGCIEQGYLVNGPHSLPNNYMTQSSYWDDRHLAAGARLHRGFTDPHVGAWCPTITDRRAESLYIQASWVLIISVTEQFI